VQSGDYSGSVILGAQATATANGQMALGSAAYPIGPVTIRSISFQQNTTNKLNGNLYKILMYQA
jgi:hypothetical protein